MTTDKTNDTTTIDINRRQLIELVASVEDRLDLFMRALESVDEPRAKSMWAKDIEFLEQLRKQLIATTDLGRKADDYWGGRHRAFLEGNA